MTFPDPPEGFPTPPRELFEKPFTWKHFAAIVAGATLIMWLLG